MSPDSTRQLPLSLQPSLPTAPDYLAAVAAIGRSMHEPFDPERFLDAFSAALQPLVPHDRLVIDLLDESGRTFTVFAECATDALRLHQDYYTTTFAPEARYLVSEWVIATVFAGASLHVDNFSIDPRFRAPNPFESRLIAAGIRSGVFVPLDSGGRTIGALAVTSLTPSRYTEEHLKNLRDLALLISPFVHSAALFQRERRRRKRLAALDGFTRILGGSLDVRDVFRRLADALRPLVDFEVVGVALLHPSGRDVEMLAEIDDAPTGTETPARIPLDDFSFAARIEAGETVLIHDAPAELDPTRPGDRLIIEDGGRASLIVPLRFGDRVGGGLYFGKRRPHWFDRLDVEIADAVAAQVVLAIQHQRLAEDQRRLHEIESRAHRLEERLESLRDALGERYGFDHILGRSPALRDALNRAAKAAPTETTVLLTGESGTGKELVARAIHHASQRADRPFVAINCAALPETLLESELFGHEKGAFTGADRMKVGRFEIAAGGTLFLDEVSELSPAVQAKLLRVLQEREFQRVGGTATLRADVRLIAATNRDLAHAVAAGRFRDDLFYRLNVFTVLLPPLRERGEDVLLLADHFVRTIGARMAKPDLGLSRDARQVLLSHSWPGNIRELQNAVERGLIVSEAGLLTAAHLGITVPPQHSFSQGPSEAGNESLSEVERKLVVSALEQAKGNKSKAATTLGLTRSQLYTRMKRYNLPID